jgi:excinuclease ABC subunit C
MKDIKTFLSRLTHHPGVYQMLGKNGEILYVGKAKDLKKRVSSYFSKRIQDPKTQSLVEQIHRIDITVTHNENEAVLLECNLIKQHQPRYNILLRDDKSYPYILITNQHTYPRIDIYRGQRKKNGLYFGPYPSSLAVRETIQLLQKIFKIRTCRDSYFAARTRPCLLYQIGRCSGPCVKIISETDYQHQINLAILFLEGKSDEVIEALQTKMEVAANALDFETAANYRDQIQRLRQIQSSQYVNRSEGDIDVIGYAEQHGYTCLQLLTIRNGQVLGSRSYFPKVPLQFDYQDVLSAFLSQHYFHDASHVESIPKTILLSMQLKDSTVLESVLSEQAGHKVQLSMPMRGDKRKWLNMATMSAKQSLAAHVFHKTNLHERIVALKEVLGLAKLPERLECFDISHTQGEATVASCVVFNQNGPLKADYRRYNIKDITPGDDVAAMRQALTRRFKRSQQEHTVMPDVLFIDGGPTQLSAAKSVLDLLQIENINLISVSKGPGRKAGFESLHQVDKAQMHLPADSVALHFIQHIRDEAHRFAITGHRQRRDKVRRESILESIPGIGAKRRRDLLRYFGGIQGIAHASLEELTKVDGISLSLAERIFAALHDATL